MLSKIKVFFNASVLLAGLSSPRGGSAKVLGWSKKGMVKGHISEIVLDEAKRHANKINFTPKKLEGKVLESVSVDLAPEKLSHKYKKLVRDEGDVHILTSARNLKVDYLVSLDKRHILALSDKIDDFKIVSPGELIIILEDEL